MLSREQPFWLLVLQLAVPGVVPYLVNCVTGIRVGVEYLRDKVSTVRGQELGKFVFSCQDLLVEVRGLWILEGQEATNHGVENHAAAPNVRS